MKKNKTNNKSMLRHSQTVGGNERFGNNFKDCNHIFEFIEIDLIECTECGLKQEV